MTEKDKTFLLESSKEVVSLLNGKVIVVKPLETDGIVPLFCKCCLFPMKTIEDSISFRKKKVCNKCQERWYVFSDTGELKEPNKNTQEWDEYIKTRTILERPTIKLK